VNQLLLWLSLLCCAQVDGADGDPAPASEDEQAVLSVQRRRLEQDPDDRAAAWQVGYILYSQGDFEGARRIFEDSERRHGPMAYSSYMLAAIAEQEFRYWVARDLYESCLSLDSEYAPAREALLRLEGVLSDLARFRSARNRVTRELVLVLIAATFLLCLAGITMRRAREAEAGPRPPGPEPRCK
jgi:tetratricopeptide (TPR) repeat protein